MLDRQTCHYLRENSGSGAQCAIARNNVDDILGADITRCADEHFNTCSIYRSYNEDHIEV